MEKNDINKVISDHLENYATENQYGVSKVPYHTHNGTDSPPIANTGGSVISFYCQGASAVASTTNHSNTFQTFNSVTAESEAQMAWPMAGKFRNLYVRNRTVATNNVVITLRINGADTALTTTVTAGNTGVFTDTTHIVSVAVGDLITLKWVTGAVTQAFLTGMTLEFDQI